MFSLLVMGHSGPNSRSHSFSRVSFMTSGRSGARGPSEVRAAPLTVSHLPVFSWGTVWPGSSLQLQQSVGHKRPVSTPETSALVARRGFISRGILGLLRSAYLSGETVRQLKSLWVRTALPSCLSSRRLGQLLAPVTPRPSRTSTP